MGVVLELASNEGQNLEYTLVGGLVYILKCQQQVKTLVLG